MKSVIRTANHYFITLILVIFYFLILGLSALILKIVKLNSQKKDASTYWVTVKYNEFKKSYFQSSF